MTVSRQPDPAAAPVVRPYANGDYDAGRSRWTWRHQWVPGASLHGLDFDY